MNIAVKPVQENRSPVPAVAKPSTPAHVIKSDAEAIEVATRLAAEFVKGAAERDRDRIWPSPSLTPFRRAACGRSTFRRNSAVRKCPM